jgi:hypothetical protein
MPKRCEDGFNRGYAIRLVEESPLGSIGRLWTIPLIDHGSHWKRTEKNEKIVIAPNLSMEKGLIKVENEGRLLADRQGKSRD